MNESELLNKVTTLVNGVTSQTHEMALTLTQYFLLGMGGVTVSMLVSAYVAYRVHPKASMEWSDGSDKFPKWTIGLIVASYSLLVTSLVVLTNLYNIYLAITNPEVFGMLRLLGKM